MAIEREATCVWEGTLARGSGRMSAASSVAFTGMAFSLPTRVGQPADETSPEELMAAAHAGCFAMALAAILTDAGVPPGRLDVRCRVTLDDNAEQGFRITRSALVVGAEVDGLAHDALKAAVETADVACPYSALVRDAGATVDVEIVR